MPKNKPAGFMSYVNSDDKYGQLTTLRERLSDEVQMQIGTEFPIFQDRKDIHWGQNWKERIENSLDETTFLIPIITPSFFNSKACREELARFLEREKKLDRNDLILPVYFVDTPLLNKAELRASDDLAEVIASRQYADWRELRFEPFTNPQVGKTFEKLAVQIREALPRVQTRDMPKSKKAPVKSAASNAQPSVSTTGGAGEQRTEGPTPKQGPLTRIVDPWHRGDFATISDAIKAVAPGTRILVRPGLYQEGLVVDKPLEIVGDGEPGGVVIQAAGSNVILFQTTMGRIVNLSFRQLGGDKYCVDIAQGRLELEDCDITSQSQACVGIHGGADPRLRRNRIHHSKRGSGVVLYENAKGTLEDNEIFGNALSAVEIKEGADPMVRRNRLRDGKGAGVHVHESGQGTLEDNDISGNPLAGVQIKSGANPTLRRNRIHDSGSGVFVLEGGQGIFEDNDIFGNRLEGVEIKKRGNPIFRNNRINKNARYGVRVYENSGCTFENNDLTDNGKGAWIIAKDSQTNVTRVNNKE